jgi:hypothetical protein
MKKVTVAILVALTAIIQPTKASTLMQYEVIGLTSGGVDISTGTAFFISWGTDAAFNSGSFTSGATSLISASDKLLYSATITGGMTSGAWDELYTSPVAAGQNITALFIAGSLSPFVDTATGNLKSGFQIVNSGGSSFSFGTVRNASADTVGGNVPDAIAWTLPANAGATASIGAYAAGQGGDFVSALNTTASFQIGSVVTVPEPSVASLFALGTVGLVALRARRKS